jgi:hypothetical protein
MVNYVIFAFLPKNKKKIAPSKASLVVVTIGVITNTCPMLHATTLPLSEEGISQRAT